MSEASICFLARDIEKMESSEAAADAKRLIFEIKVKMKGESTWFSRKPD